VLCTNAELQQSGMQCKSPIGVNAQTSKAEICLPQAAAQMQRGFTGFCAVVLCISAGLQMTRLQCKPIGVIAQTSKAEICLPEEAAQVQEGFTGFIAVVLCIRAEL